MSRRLLSTVRVAVAYQNETKLLGQMLYYVLTTSAGQQTLGEEYCDITQVHFAATKDSLSRHFNKFGDVLKVVILTDAGTGQPKGSAYVEFMRKEAAEHALSLDGTSFMSRILKILVATPGRLKDHIENTMGFATRLMGVKVLILDEADHLLDMGFCKDIEKIIVVVPKERQTLLFSATVPRYSKSLASTLLILAYH